MTKGTPTTLARTLQLNLEVETTTSRLQRSTTQQRWQSIHPINQTRWQSICLKQPTTAAKHPPEANLTQRDDGGKASASEETLVTKQSMLPNIPGNPRASPTWRKCSVSSTVGCHRYSGPNTSITPCIKFSKHSNEVLSASFKYSSRMLAVVPYASIRMVAVHFCNGESPRRPVQSTL